MIHITFDRKKSSVTVKGHAGSGEAGHDLVCSAVSALVYTLAADVDRLGYPSVIRLDAGDAEISCTPDSAYRLMVEYLYESICVGFEMLAEEYSEFIQYQIVEG